MRTFDSSNGKRPIPMPDQSTVLLKFLLDESVVGDVVGRLSSEGGYLDAVEASDDGQFEVRVRLPVGTVRRIEEWFSKVSGGKGKMLRPAVGGETPR